MSNTVSKEEIAKFESMAEDWWNPYGKFKPLHDLTPLRLEYITNIAKNHFKIDSLKGIKTLDIGCGGGLVAEPLANLGVDITGIDASLVNINIAKAHAFKSGLMPFSASSLTKAPKALEIGDLLNVHDIPGPAALRLARDDESSVYTTKKLGININYQQILAEDLVKTGEKFQLILALEIIEHVENIEFFIQSCLKLLEPGGLIIFSTINKTVKSFLMAIVGAEYILRWLPIGTHNWSKFVKPSQIYQYAKGTKILDIQGLSYSILSRSWFLSHDISNNYFISLVKN